MPRLSVRCEKRIVGLDKTEPSSWCTELIHQLIGNVARYLYFKNRPKFDSIERLFKHGREGTNELTGWACFKNVRAYVMPLVQVEFTLSVPGSACVPRTINKVVVVDKTERRFVVCMNEYAIRQDLSVIARDVARYLFDDDDDLENVVEVLLSKKNKRMIRQYFDQRSIPELPDPWRSAFGSGVTQMDEQTGSVDEIGETLAGLELSSAASSTAEPSIPPKYRPAELQALSKRLILQSLLHHATDNFLAANNLKRVLEGCRSIFVLFRP